MEGELDADDLSAVMTLVLMKQEDINSLEAAALAMLELNKLDVSDEILEKTFENTTLEKVVEGANLFARYGIIPEVEVVDPMLGGVKRLREEVVEEPLLPRSRTPSKKAIEAAESPFLSEAEQKKQTKSRALLSSHIGNRSKTF
jgi:hypothetical protein